MSGAAPVDVPRLIRLATLFFALLAASLVYFGYRSQIEALQYRIEDAEAALRSDEVAASEMPRLRDERNALAARYSRLLRQNAEAVFLRELMTIARARGLTLLTTSLVPGNDAPHDGTRLELLVPTRVTLQLQGPYRNVLVAISELSTGSEIVAVEPPTMRRDGSVVDASVPVTIYEPTRSAGAER
ncbi:MAG: hypothetical protein IAI50_11655 [Candidatus Eremiobacteraeota bacterium]|nr:hypothetical protein [Candidatus Eremiobacteraeota bacterium]